MSGVEKLRRAVDEFHSFIRELPEEALVAKAWGPKEVLAHEVFWSESYVAQLQPVIAGQPPEPPRGGLDHLNAQAVEANRDAPVDDLSRRLRMATDWLCGFAQAHDPESIVLEYLEGAPEHTLTWLLSAEASHIRHHLRHLVRQAGRDPAREGEKLRKVVEEFCCFIRKLPEETVVEQVWGSKEVLAHLVFWHESCVAQIRAGLAGEPCRAPEGRLKDLNAQAVEASYGVSVDTLVCRFRMADELLRRFGQTLDPQHVVLRVQSNRYRNVSTIVRPIYYPQVGFAH